MRPVIKIPNYKMSKFATKILKEKIHFENINYNHETSCK